jgi:hypothetical protein
MESSFVDLADGRDESRLPDCGQRQAHSCKNPLPKVLGKGDRVDMFDANKNENMNLSETAVFLRNPLDGASLRDSLCPCA